MDSIFGEVISTYTRKQAIEDGVLIDVSLLAKEAGFRFPVAVTSGVFSLLEKNFNGILWDVLNVLRFSIKQSQGRDFIAFKVLINHKYKNFISKCGPGDEMEPVITIMLPGED